MQLLKNDPAARDIKYHNIQKNLPWLDPPELGRLHVEELWQVASAYLDRNFAEEIKHDFSARYAELYFAGAFIDRLSFELAHPADEGLDFYIRNLDCWAEVVAATDGEAGNPNSIPAPRLNRANRYPEDQVLLRLTSAIEAKSKKVLQDIEKGLVSIDQRVVICISGGGMKEYLPTYPAGGYPQIVKAVLPLGDLTFWLSRESREVVDQSYTYRESVIKQTSDGPLDIGTKFFLEPEHSHVSAVLYSWRNAWHPVSKQFWGCDFFLVHNPLARNPLPIGSIKCGREILVQADDESFSLKPPVDHEHSLQGDQEGR